MKIDSIVIENLKSFQSETEISFNTDFNILIGPNGCGKSNLLDILTICMRQFFLIPVHPKERQDGTGLIKELQLVPAFNNIQSLFKKFYGNESDSKIKLRFRVTKEDIENIELIRSKKDLIFEGLSIYSNGTAFKRKIEAFLRFNLDDLVEDLVLEYEIINNQLTNEMGGNSLNKAFLAYLNSFELFIALSKNNSELQLKTNYLFFSPFRGTDINNLQANLSSQNYYQSFQQVANGTTKKVFSLISLASIYFAEKRRKFEMQASNVGFLTQWEEDPEVALVTKYLKNLGYDWDLKCVNSSSNIYEIILKKDGYEFLINEASAGEKEILNFLMGVFAFNLHDGIFIVDEPELHLHPRWQNILLELFFELSEITNNQIIISSHSPTFINDDSYKSIIRIFKDEDNSSKCVIPHDNEDLKIKDILHIINTTNNERLFFCDAAILVEGITDRLVFEKIIADVMKSRGNSTKVVEVIEIKGKSNVDVFRNFLNELNVPSFFISDLDYINEVGSKEIKDLFEINQRKIKKDVIKNQKSYDGDVLCHEMERAIQTEDLEELKNVWEYIKSFRRKPKTDLSEEQGQILNSFLSDQKQNNNFILSIGDIEEYFPEEFKRKDLSNVISLLNDANYAKWKNDPKFNELESIIIEILNNSKIISA